MSRARKIAIALGVVILLAAARFYSLSDISHESIRLHLALLGSSIYEYHAKTGQWPARAEDLAQTSLPARSPYWKVMLDAGTNVVVWHQDLKPEPAQNAGVILAYHNRGLLAWLDINGCAGATCAPSTYHRVSSRRNAVSTNPGTFLHISHFPHF